MFPNNNGSTTYSATNLKTVKVKWDDTYHGGNLKVEVSNCSGGSPIGELASSDYSIASFFGQTFAHVGSANGKLILDTSDLPKGMYYLHVLAGGEIIRKQVLKDK